MDIDRSVIEGALPAGQQTCAGLGDSAEQQSEQRPRQRKAEEGDLMSRDALQQALLNLAYDNTGSMCYANCSVTCLIWACLSRHNFTVGEWGEPASQLCEVLRHTDGLFQIDGQEWYHSLVANWDAQHGQADSAEFTSLLVHWVAPASCSCLWQRRWMQCENVYIHDNGDTYQPLMLQIQPTLRNPTVAVPPNSLHVHPAPQLVYPRCLHALGNTQVTPLMKGH